MLKVKHGVQPRSLIIAAAAANVAHDLGIEIVITSGNDSTHMPGSKHYSGEALDFRTRTLKAWERDLFVDRMTKRLGPTYDIVIEVDHIHVEYDPHAA